MLPQAVREHGKGREGGGDGWVVEDGHERREPRGVHLRRVWAQRWLAMAAVVVPVVVMVVVAAVVAVVAAPERGRGPPAMST